MFLSKKAIKSIAKQLYEIIKNVLNLLTFKIELGVLVQSSCLKVFDLSSINNGIRIIINTNEDLIC